MKKIKERKIKFVIMGIALLIVSFFPLVSLANAQEPKARTSAEVLTSRALVAVDAAGADTKVTDTLGNEYESGVYLSWRVFEEDPDDVKFTLYRNGQEIASGLTMSNLIDEGGTAGDQYKVVGSSDHRLGIEAQEIRAWDEQFLELHLYKPESQIMPDGSKAFFTANDMSVGDVTGDGELDLIVKWAPSNSKDNSHSGFTGTTIIDAYEIDTSTGEVQLLWRIDLGVNIRSGAHYTQFQVWDFNGDGHADIAMKTADGSTIYKSLDGTDQNLVQTGYVGAVPASELPTYNRDSQYDFRNNGGYILDGPEYFTIFNGKTGEIMDTTDYLPARGTDLMADWGDDYGNRVDRYLSAVAFLDGENPYAVFARGYYTRTALTAYYVDENDKIQVEWAFDSKYYDFSDSHLDKSDVEGMGFHSLSVNDVDGDGKDEIIYGAVVFNHDGSPRYSTGLGHGDAMHVSDWVPWNDGLEVMTVHESSGAELHVAISDAATGEILMGYWTGRDTGRGVAGDIDPTSEGAEFWAGVAPGGSGNPGVYSTTSTLDNLVRLSEHSPTVNFTIFWDGDLLTETFDHVYNSNLGQPVATTISKWNYIEGKDEHIFYSEDVWTSNSTKGNAGLVADILGDWREEIIVRHAGGATESEHDHKVRIYTTGYETDYVIPTLLQNHAYRVGIAWQNVAYNQPANLDYLLSEGLITAQLQKESRSTNEIQFSFTEASDGVHGHDVEGYEIYRAVNKGEYQLIDDLRNLDFNNDGRFTYTDTNVAPNNEYSYQVAAIVNGRTGHLSMPLTVTDETIVGFEDRYQEVALGAKLEQVQLPTTVTALLANGQMSEVPVESWDTSNWDTSEIGVQELSGTVAGYEDPVTLNLYVDYDPLFRFDFGVDQNLVEEGWTGINVNQRGGNRSFADLGIAYDTEKGYGFIVEDINARALEGRTESYRFNGILPQNVYSDFALVTNTEFAVDVPNGDYIVEIVATTALASNNRVRYSIEGGNPVTISNAINTYTMGREEVQVTDGQLNIQFLDPGVPSRMGAIIVRPVN